ncbi:bifunctional oligoribonuclease/PAP phosphatase NrnA [Acholeplasma equirhinis]|uniref:DHH family phosphoesterase n=1 Tax=Acholeplasma equirhinis TaxID=555393 RepID=UPI00197ABA06|nr:bifunctional oligoribonuclease/PAP phosphatase NrnA [Acholeplasma equirhinis]MBN3491033.1 bifunctional oligoribonuclease/PAP phosphatase NrnA [Acholeplasma equirhinis]
MILKTIYNKIKKYPKIIIYGHIRPDGDCYGAQFGLKNLIQNAFPEKEVYVTSQLSEAMQFVGMPDIVVPSDLPDSFYSDALSIVVDTATADRVSNPKYTLGLEVIKIDHHIPIDQYGDYQWVDTSFPSCAQMIAYFSTKFKKLKITKPGAVAMYTGILTDTGRFKYRGVSELTHQMAGMLLNHGADVEEIDKQLSIESLDMIRFKGFVYQNFKTTDKGFIYLIITDKIREEFKLSYEEASSVVNMLGGIEGFPVWAIFIEDKGEIRVRLRSNGPDIDKVANQFRGGGHAKASGATLSSLDELDQFIEAVHKVL